MHYKEERVLALKGEDGRVTHERISPRDLDGDHRIVVRQGSTVPQSVAAEQAQIIELREQACSQTASRCSTC